MTANELCLSDLAYSYGFTDESHMLHEFKKFHSINISQARIHAFKDVAFLQYKEPNHPLY